MSCPIRPLCVADSGFVAHIEQAVMADAWDKKALADWLAMPSVGGFGYFGQLPDMPLANMPLINTPLAISNKPLDINNQSLLLVGYLLYQLSDVAEILRIGTACHARRQGIGKQLLGHFLATLPTHIHSVLLEVRQDNAPAIALYRLFGFECIHIRQNYYRNGDHSSTHALIMQKILPSP